MPPNVAAFLHMNVVSGAAKNDYALHRSAITKCVIDIFLQGYNAAAAIGAVGCDNSNGAAIVDAVANAVCTKSAEYDRMHRTNARGGQHGNRGLGNIREINDHPVALFDIVPF